MIIVFLIKKGFPKMFSSKKSSIYSVHKHRWIGNTKKIKLFFFKGLCLKRISLKKRYLKIVFFIKKRVFQSKISSKKSSIYTVHKHWCTENTHSTKKPSVKKKNILHLALIVKNNPKDVECQQKKLALKGTS